MKKFLISLIASLALIMASGAAWADYVTHHKNPDGSHIYVYFDKDGKTIKSTHLYDKNGNHVTSSFYGNPNPEGDGKGTGDPKSSIKDKAALLLQKGGTLLPEADAFWKTPLGKHLAKQGKGKGKYNQTSQPGPDDDGLGGPSLGGGSNLGKGQKQFKTEIGGKIGGMPFQPNSGGVKGYISKNKGKKGKKDSDDDSNDPTHGKGLFGDLPGPPELVNPNPVSRGKGISKQPGAAGLRLPSPGINGGSVPAIGGGKGSLR